MRLFKDDTLKRNKISFLLTVIFLILSFITNAQSPTLKTLINKQNILIGEPLQLKIEASIPLNKYKVNWLNIPDSTHHFEVVERHKIDSAEDAGLLKLTQIITLTSFDSGLRTIPRFVVNFDPINDDTTLNLFTDSIRINVSFSPMDSTKTFHDIKTIIDVKDEWPLWMWIAAILSAALVIFLVYYLFKNSRKKKPQALFTSKLTPLEEAFQSLGELENQQLLNKQGIKLFHSKLTEIFKRYISRKTNSNLYILTSDEILIKLNEMQISKENSGLVVGNLKMADAVKFAKYIPDDGLSQEAFLNVKKVIQQIDQTMLNPKSDI